MAKVKVGDLIKEARTNAKLSQEALAAKIDGVSASDISKAERGEKELSQTALKQIAKATGVTQKSLLEAAAGSSSSKKTESAKKTESKTSSSKKTETKTSSSKKTESTKKTEEFKLTETEKKLVDLYRKADSDTKKKAVALLKGESDNGDIASIVSGALEMLMNKK